MLFSVISQLNWVDIVFISLFIRILYIAAKNGFIIEVFKLMGLIATIYISLHYYTVLSNLIIKSAHAEQFPVKFFDFFIFLLLVLVTYGFFGLLRNIFCNFVKMEAVPALSKWGAFILGFFRGILAAGLLAFLFAVSTTPYLNTSVAKSYYGRYLFDIVVSTYSGLWNGAMSKFMVNEKFNKGTLEIKAFGFPKDSR